MNKITLVDYLLYLTLIFWGSAVNAGVAAFSKAAMDPERRRAQFNLLLLVFAVTGLLWLTARGHP